MPALTFATPLLLIGLSAAAIPLVLHLLSTVQAQETDFPTLRFLQMSMEKTARRRRIQHWILLLLRSMVLALLAVATAEPITRALGGWLSPDRRAAIIILDNSLSMSTREKNTSRFARAKAQLTSMLGGDDKPAVAAVWTTDGNVDQGEPTGRIDHLREKLSRIQEGFGRAPIAERLIRGLELLRRQKSQPQKVLYLLSDLQHDSFEPLLQLRPPDGAENIPLLIVNTAEGAPNNVGISKLEISGQAIINRPVTISATLVNSSLTARTVQAVLRIEGKRVGQPIRRRLAPLGREGCTAVIRFHHVFHKTGTVSGEIFLTGEDDLKEDNSRRFCLKVSGPIRALIVRGGKAFAEAPWLDPAGMLLLALDPFEDPSNDSSIRPTVVDAAQLQAARLRDMDIAFLCDVPSFSPRQARALADFTSRGGTVAFFLGPNVDEVNYNETLGGETRSGVGLLPGRLLPPVGVVGPDAGGLSVERVDTKHPYFADLYPEQADYLTVIVQRRYRLEGIAADARMLMRLAGGEDLLLVRPFGKGRVVLCTSTASPEWTNLPTQPLFVPLLHRMSLQSRSRAGMNHAYLVGSTIRIHPTLREKDSQALPRNPSLLVELPNFDGKRPARKVRLPLKRTADGSLEALFHGARRPGIYRWSVPGVAPAAPLASGAFVVNPSGIESDLRSIPPRKLQQALRRQGFRRAHVAPTMEEATAAAAGEAKGRNWWDWLAAAAVLVLLAEAIVANRNRREETIPSHLRSPGTDRRDDAIG